MGSYNPTRGGEKAGEPAAQTSGSEGPQVVYEGTQEPSPGMRARLAAYLGARNASARDISDDGEKILMTTRFGETTQVHMLDRPLGARKQITFLDETVSSPTFVPGRVDRIAYLSDKGGNEQYRLHHADLPANEVTAVSQEGARVQHYEWSSDGSRLAFNSNARNGKDMDIYVCDGADPASVRKVADAQGHWGPVDWSPDDRKILVMEYISIEHTRLHVVDLESGRVEEVTPKDEKASYRNALFAPGGDAIYVTTDRGGEFAQLHRFEIGTGRWELLSGDIPWNVEDIALAGDGGTLAFTVNEEGYGRLYLYSPGTDTVEKVEARAGGVIRDLMFAGKADRLAFSLDSPAAARDIYTLDTSASETVRWTEMEMGGLDPSSLSIPELVKFATFDGREIPAFYHRPKGDGPFPVVVRIHGGPGPRRGNGRRHQVESWL